jgi:hypothetical protein
MMPFISLFGAVMKTCFLQILNLIVHVMFGTIFFISLVGDQAFPEGNLIDIIRAVLG